ncbi:MAG: hypothetical protein FWC92_04695 [Defluviitaleaceae bacterium]|nr:hypothetical protein [Defluviitaleaceae bacterium]
MEKLSPIVQEAFGIQSRRIKKEKGRYIYEKAGELISIYITHEPPAAISLQHFIKEHIAAKGFPWTDRFQPITTGQPYIRLGREAYVMVKYPHQRRETDFENEADVLQAFRCLAHLHIAARDIPHTVTQILPPAAPSMPEIYTRQLSELTIAGKQARRGPRMSDFDVAFIKHAPIYSEIMQESINRLADTSYDKLYTLAINHNAICHNTLKEENLLVTNNATYIINFSEATVDIQLSDVAALIRRYAGRSSKSIHITRMLEAYDTINPLPTGAHDILYALLIFPWAFIKIVTQYYSKKRNWAPGGLISRMDTILAERESYEKYVKTIMK